MKGDFANSTFPYAASELGGRETKAESSSMQEHTCAYGQGWWEEQGWGWHQSSLPCSLPPSDTPCRSLTWAEDTHMGINTDKFSSSSFLQKFSQFSFIFSEEPISHEAAPRTWDPAGQRGGEDVFRCSGSLPNRMLPSVWLSWGKARNQKVALKNPRGQLI